MRMLKKLLLAGAFIGVLGSFGFAQEAKAADDTVTTSVTGDALSYSVTSTVSNNEISILIGGVDTGYSKTVSVDTISVNNISIKKLVNDNVSKFSANELATIEVKTKNNGSSKPTMKSLFRMAAGTVTGQGTVTVDGTSVLYDYDQASTIGTTHIVKAVANSGWKFSKWDDASTDTTGTRTEYASASKTTYGATFVEIPDYKGLTLTARVIAADGSTQIGSTYYADEYGVDIPMKINQYIIFSSKVTGGGKDLVYGWDYPETANEAFRAVQYSSGDAWRAKAEDVDEGYTAECTYDGSTYSKRFNITVSGTDPVVSSMRVNLSDFKDYITEGYTLEFKAKAESDSINLANQNAKLVISDGSDYVDSIEKTENTSDKNVTFKIKFKGEKLDKGTNSKDVKFKILVGGDSGSACPIDSNSETEKKVTVYSNPTNSYNNSDRTMSYKVPAKVNTGTESGKDSNLSYTQDTVSEVKGIRINVLLNDNILGTTTTASGKGTGATVDASTMESIITNLGNSGKFTGDCTVVFRAYPSDSSGNCNKKVYHDTYAKVYKVVLRPGQSATAGAKTASAYALPIAMIAQRNTGATTTTATTTTAAGKEYVLYGLEGQTLTVPAGVTDLVDANGNAVTKIVVSADANKNVYTYAATASAATKEGLDKVPKTGQSNVFVYVMAVVVCGAVGYGLYVYNKKSKKSI